MLEPRKKMYDKAGPRVAAALQKRNMEAYYCPTAAEAVEKVLELIPAGDVVSWGGVATVDELGIKGRLRSRNQPVIDRDTARTPEERTAMLHQALTCDTFLMSSNAISEDGQLVNIDGTGNRVSATLFGHEKVYIVIGRNKLAPTYEAAVYRARNVAAPQRARQLGKKTPCAVKADRCYDCRSPERVCRALVTLWGPMLGMETEVLLVDEDLGL